MTGPSPAADSAAAAASDASHGFEPAGFETATTERLLASETAEASPDFEPQRRARALVEALPHIQRFSGSAVVVKYGGSAMTDPALAASFARDMVLVNAVGLRAVVVHGGGPQIGEQLARMGRQSEFRDGLRVTDAETLEVVRMVLVGKIGRDIVGAVGAGGGAAVGLSGEDAGLVKVVPRDPALGFVGDITAVDPTIIEQLLVEGTVPVVAPIGADTSGQAYNINADTMAAALAGALGAAKVVYLTDVAGLLADVSDASSLLGRATASDVEAMIASGALSGGMIPKARACVDALSRGVGSAHILDGRIPHCVLLELFTDAGIGTMITRQDGPGPAHGQGTGQGASA